jgi:hypothetical protein
VCEVKLSLSLSLCHPPPHTHSYRHALAAEKVPPAFLLCVCVQCVCVQREREQLIQTHLGGGNGLPGTVLEVHLPLDHRLDFIQDYHFVALALRHTALGFSVR